jgi:hypothetical protein
MNIPQTKILSQASAEKLIADSISLNGQWHYLSEKHQLILQKGQEWLAKLYIPWTLDWTAEGKFFEKPDAHFSLVMIKAGQAVTGYFHRGELIDHRVFRAYMVRQKQGKSQIKHLKTKGKSRAGSRIRLAETARFFEEINERLISYSSQFPIDYWGISCAKTLWPHYFSSAVPPPFSSSEKSLIELPVHIAKASFEELQALGELLQKFHVLLSEQGKYLLDISADTLSPTQAEENW